MGSNSILALLLAGKYHSTIIKPHTTAYFTLPVSAKVSARVFDENDVEIRTLFNSVPYTSGDHSIYWDGKDDLRNVMPLGNYVVKFLSHNVNFTWEGTAKAFNSSDAVSGPTVHSYFGTIADMAFFQKEGIEYGDIGITFSEGRAAQYRFLVSQINSSIKYAPDATGQTTFHKCANSQFIFNGGKSYAGIHNFVFATYIANDEEVQFTQGQVMHPVDPENGRDYNWTLDLNANSGNGVITGMCCTEKYLFLAHKFTNTINVYRIDDLSGSFVRTISMSNVTKITNEGQDKIWITQSTTAKKFTINSDGTLSSALLTISGLTSVAGISQLGTDLIIFDGSTQQIIKRYNSNTGAFVSSIGEVGGYVNSPVVSLSKFYIYDPSRGDLPTYVRHQSDGSFWVGDTGNKRNLHFAANGTFIDEITYLGATYNLYPVTSQPNVVITDCLEYLLDFTKPIASRATLINNWAYHYPATVIHLDGGGGELAPRPTVPIGQGMWSGIGLFDNGRRYGIGSLGDYGYYIFELATNGIKAIDGSYIEQFGKLSDELGVDIGYGTYPFTGYDTYTDGEPYPKFGPIQYFERPPIGSVYPDYTERKVWKTSNGYSIIWDENKDSQKFALAAYDPNDPTKWKWKNLPSTINGYAGDFVDDAKDIFNNVKYPGGPIGVAEDIIIAAYRGENWKNGQTSKFFVRTEDGFALGTPGIVQNQIEDIEQPAAMYATNILGLFTQKVGNKVYWMVNDENGHGLQSWVMDNLNSIQRQTVNFKLTNNNPVEPTNVIDLLSGIPENNTFVSGAVEGWTRYPIQDDARMTLRTRLFQNDLNKSPDIYAVVNGYESGGAINYFLNRTIPFNVLKPNWKIFGKLDLNAFYVGSEGPYEKTHIAVLDSSDKVIFKIYFYQTGRISINGNYISTPGKKYPLSNFEISRSGTNVYWKFIISDIEYSGTVVKEDATANLLSPGAIVFTWAFGGHPSNANLDINELNYLGT